MTLSPDNPLLPALAQPLEALVSAIESVANGQEESPAPRVILGPPASGRRVLLHQVSHEAEIRHQHVLSFELLPFGHDTPAHLLFQIASRAPDGCPPNALTDIKAAWRDRFDAADKILDAVDARVFLVRFPAGAPPGGERSDRQLQQETSDVLALLTKPRANKLHIIAAPKWWKWPHPAKLPVTLPLKPSCDASQFLGDKDQWGNLSSYAAHLQQIVTPHGNRLSPLQLRLGVALLAGSADAKTLRTHLAPHAMVRDLEPLLQQLLDKRPQLGKALVRVSRARTAVDSNEFKTLAAAGDEWELISHCFLYPEGGDKLRFHDQLQWLVPATEAGAETEAHAQLRRYYEKLDGALDPHAGLRNVIPYLEKLHHAGCADSNGDVDAWLKINPPTREHFWEFGWSLSFVHHKYSAAAKVFRELLARVPNEDDNYAQHYLAFNLDKAGASPVEAEHYYRHAVTGDPTNVWWNARLVRFLTGRGKFDAALRAWNEALETIDPDGQRSATDWLSMNLHKPVIDAALDSADLRLAEAAFGAVRPPADSFDVFRWLKSEIDAARQVRRLGEALFPAKINFLDWWKPRLLIARPGERFERWRAGRVLAVTPSEVSLALGHKEGDEPVVKYQVVPRATWQEASNDDNPAVGDFFEAAFIDEALRIVSEKQPAEPIDEDRVINSLRFLSSAQWMK